MSERASLFRRAKKLYSKLEADLVAKHRGDFLAIEPDSGDCVLGKDEAEVALEAIRRHPGKEFGFFRVGCRAAHKLRRVPQRLGEFSC